MNRQTPGEELSQFQIALILALIMAVALCLDGLFS